MRTTHSMTTLLFFVALAIHPLGCGDSDPPATDPGAGDSGSTGTEAEGTEATDPESTDPESTDPEATDPESTDPEGTDPESTDPQGTDPEGTDPENTDPQPTDSTDAPPVSDGCGHDIDPGIVSYGFNTVVDSTGKAKSAQGKPLQEGDGLIASDVEVTDHNDREYARIAAFMMPIRDVLMCDVATTTEEEWLALTEVLTLNGIKTKQDLSGTPKEQFYSTAGIFEHLQDGEDFHPMMKYLEEAELELKCLAFKDFNFTNPEGDNHCEIHGLAEGSGLKLP